MKNSIACETCGERTDDADIVDALREWFKKKELTIGTMDHDTYMLWRKLEGLK